MSMQSILGAAGTATVDVCDVERLMLQRDDARAERDRARDLAAALEQICAEREALLWLAIGTPESKATEEEIGRRIARHLRESGARPPSEVGA